MTGRVTASGFLLSDCVPPCRFTGDHFFLKSCKIKSGNQHHANGATPVAARNRSDSGILFPEFIRRM